MNSNQFRASLEVSVPPAQFMPLLAALWWDGKGNWDQAHEIAQAEDSPDAAWVHAYLHRKEGDQWNAGYWYRRARRPVCASSIEDEWLQIVEYMLASRVKSLQRNSKA